MSATVRTIREYYRVGGARGECFDDLAAAVRGAFATAAQGNYASITVERVTVHEPYADGVWGQVTETVTGEISIPGPAHYMQRPELSRYHPVNGWAIPETITVGV